MWLASSTHLTRGGVQRRALLLSAWLLVAEEESPTSSTAVRARRNAMPSAPLNPKCVPATTCQQHRCRISGCIELIMSHGWLSCYSRLAGPQLPTLSPLNGAPHNKMLRCHLF